MTEKKILQMLKLANWVISGPRSLLALKAANANSNMRCKNHIHIIGTIANGQCRDNLLLLFLSLADEPYDLRLLLWRHTACDYNTSIVGNYVKLVHHFQFLFLFRTRGDLHELLAADDNSRLTRVANMLLLLYKIWQLLLYSFALRLVNYEDLHLVIEDTTTEANVDGRLNLVARQNPELDACLPDITDYIRNVIL